MTDHDDEELEDIPVVDLDRADYVLSVIAKARRIRDEELAFLARQVDRISLLRKAAEERCARVEDWYRPQLESFHLAVLRDDPKRKSIELLHGALKARKQPDTVTVVDDEAFFENAGDGLVRVKREPDKRALLAYVKDTGEVPPGVQYVPGDVKVTVETTP